MIQKTRRRFLGTIGASCIVGAAGCSSSENTNTDNSTAESTVDDPERTEATAEPTSDEGSSEARWSMFQASATNTGTLATTPATDGQQEWQFRVDDGRLRSAPVVVDGTVYIGENFTQNVYALAAGDGSEQWQAEVGAGENDTVQVSPAVVDGAAYAVTYQTLTALAVSDGSRQAQFQHEKRTDSFDGLLTVVDETAYIGVSDQLYAVTVRSSETNWVFGTEAAVGDAPTVSGAPAVENETVFVTNDAQGARLYAVDMMSGEEVWSTDEVSSPGSPAVANETVYIGDARGVAAFSATDGTEQWRFEISDQTAPNQKTAPAIADQTVYFSSAGNRFVHALDATDGTERWRFESDESGEIFTSPIVVDDYVYVGSNTSTVYALNAEDGTVRWRFDTQRSGVSSAPAVVDGTLYVTDYDTLYAVS
jgi:outer membrane protein assembly factor BamB